MKHIVFRILFALVLIAAITGIALLAYNAGVTHGTSLNVQPPTGQDGSQAYPAYGMPFWGPFPFFGFGCFGLLGVLFLIFVAFGAARRMVFGPGYGWHRWHHRYGAWSDQGSGEGVPPKVAEMHRRMHEAEGKSADQATQKKE